MNFEMTLQNTWNLKYHWIQNPETFNFTLCGLISPFQGVIVSGVCGFKNQKKVNPVWLFTDLHFQLTKSD